VEIGRNTILWSGNHIGHHTRIGDNVFIASHVVVSGAVSVGDNCFLGVNATLRDNISIGSHVVVGAGALVLHDAPDYAVFPGRGTEVARIRSDQLRRI
jgi:acetyltransferase-like isoleucine patch superfamily enzyme